ncbi:natriuretic peptides A [Nelusetta ayraudi]|uniref:natriuretic peptides A n=1 Tax=Nelusetta ayraudi TaxID=303726 RepID=UPI003F6E7146
MRMVVLWGLLVLLQLQTLVGGHTLGRPASSASELDQLQDLLERFEETLAEAVQAGDSESDYEANEQEPGHFGQEVNPEQQRDRQPLAGGRFQSPVDSLSRTASGRRSHLLDLLMSRRRAASCFGARMDRIGNSGGLGCNSGKG